MRKTAILGILALLAVLAMPTVSANHLYLLPDNSSVPGYCDTTEVELWLNATEQLQSGNVNITYICCCANVTDYASNLTIFEDQSVGKECGWLNIGFANWVGGAPANVPAGLYHLGNITIHCCNTTPPCQTDLLFSYAKLWYWTGLGGDELSRTTDNGTFTCGTPSDEVDLNVTNIYFNPGDKRANETLRVYVNQSNDITAIVRNNGPDDVTGDFDVCFEVDGNKIDCVTVTGGLLAGAEKSVPATWTPTCANYSVMPGYPAQSLPFTINVTADCNCGNCPNCPDGSCGKITETDEANNTLSMYVPAIDPTKYNGLIGGIVNNGYKSKHCDCNTAEDPLEGGKVWRNLIGGGLVYNVTGAELALANGSTDTRVHHIDLPPNAKVKEARLYVYWRDDFYSYRTYPSGCLANLSANMSSACGTSPAVMPIEATYQDSKGFENYQAPLGMYVFNVTPWVCNNSAVDYTVNVTNIDPGNVTKLMGEMLVVVYEGDGDELTHIWMNEGTDFLYAADDTHGTYAFHVSPAEATATIPFSGTDTIPSNISSATLTAVASYGEVLGSNLLINGNVLKKDAWMNQAYPSSHIEVEEESLQIGTDFIVGINNSMGFMDNDTNGFYAFNTFLVVEERSDVLVEIDPCPATIGSDPSDRKTVNITLEGITDYGSGTIHLYFDTTYVDIDSIGLGDSTNLHSNKVTDGHYTISASNSGGISGDVAFANVAFKPMGPTTGCSYLNFVVEKLYDRNFTILSTVVNNCTICIEESNIPGVTAPTASPTRILNDNGRDRAQLPVSTNLSTLSVWVTDDTEVDTVTINLTPIRGAGSEAVSMALVSGTKQAGTWEVETNADHDPGVNLTHCLVVNATDTHGNPNTANCVILEVLRRGDIDPVNVSIPQDNIVDILDYNEIAKYTVGLRSMPDEFTAGTVPANSHNGVDMADALYIALGTVDPSYVP